MTTENDTPQQEAPPTKVVAKFKSSSTKGGQEAYELTVTDSADAGDVDATVANAIMGRKLMREALAEDEASE